MIAELFAVWRAEINTEIDAAQQELAAAEAALADAEVARRTARANALAMKVALDRLIPEPSPWPTQREPIASALMVRANDRGQAERAAAGAVASATGQIAILHERIADLQLALRQIDVITAPPVDADVDAADADQVDAEAA